MTNQSVKPPDPWVHTRSADAEGFAWELDVDATARVLLGVVPVADGGFQLRVSSIDESRLITHHTFVVDDYVTKDAAADALESFASRAAERLADVDRSWPPLVVAVQELIERFQHHGSIFRPSFDR